MVDRRSRDMTDAEIMAWWAEGKEERLAAWKKDESRRNAEYERERQVLRDAAFAGIPERYRGRVERLRAIADARSDGWQRIVRIVARLNDRVIPPGNTRAITVKQAEAIFGFSYKHIKQVKDDLCREESRRKAAESAALIKASEERYRRIWGSNEAQTTEAGMRYLAVVAGQLQVIPVSDEREATL